MPLIPVKQDADPDWLRGVAMRKRTQGYSLKVRQRAQKQGAQNKSTESSEIKRMVFKKAPPLPSSALNAPSPYLSTSRRASVPSPRREVVEFHESGKPDIEWSNRHHVTWSMGNASLHRNKRIYFDPLPQVRVIAGSYCTVPVFFPDSGADADRHDLQRRWQTRHYPFQPPPPEMRAVLKPRSASSSRHSLASTGELEEAAALRLPPLAGEDEHESQAVDILSELPVMMRKDERRATIRRRKSFFSSEMSATRKAADPSAENEDESPATKKSAMAATAQCLSHFVDWCHEKYKNMVQVFRILDKAGGMKLTRTEFKIGLHQLNYKQDLDRLWHILDRDQTGWISFVHFGGEDAVVLAHFKHWADSYFGGAKGVFRALDTIRDGKLSFKEFSAGLVRLGFTKHVQKQWLRTLFELIDDSFEQSSKRSITAEEISFLDKWECPEYLWTEADHEGKCVFLKALTDRFNGNPLLAWRKALDTDGSMRASYYEFINAHKQMVSKNLLPDDLDAGSVPALFRAMDPANAGWVSLREVDATIYDTLIAFKKWATEKFGRVSLCCKFMADQALQDDPDNEEDGTNKVTFKWFRKVLKESMGLERDEAWQLFEGVTLDSKKTAVLKPDDLLFLDRWDFKAEAEERINWEEMMNTLEENLFQPDEDEDEE